MYQEGLGFRAIGRILKVSHTAVFGWVKQAGASVELPTKKGAVKVVKVDKTHTCIGKNVGKNVGKNIGKNVGKKKLPPNLNRRKS